MINPRVSSLSHSTTLKITALTKKLRKEGKDIVNFAAGEPDFDTPPFIKEEAKKAIDSGYTKYTPSVGTQELREAIAKKLREENAIAADADMVIVTSGAKYAIFAALFALVDCGDEVIIPSPYWLSYPEMVKLLGGTIKIIPTYSENDFSIDIKDLKRVITKKTKVLILNYPNNPTGKTYASRDLENIRDLVLEKNIYVLSDEIYERLTYDGLKHTSFASLKEAQRFVVTINGFSKAFSMTGWRLGYLVCEPLLAKEISKIIDHTTSCASSVAQLAALAAFTNKGWVEGMLREFQKRRDILWQGLLSETKAKVIKPQGTFYMLCDIHPTNLSSLDFSSQLLERYLVSTIPLDSFGAEGFVRLSFATSIEDIQKGIERIKKFLAEL